MKKVILIPITTVVATSPVVAVVSCGFGKGRSVQGTKKGGDSSGGYYSPQGTDPRFPDVSLPQDNQQPTDPNNPQQPISNPPTINVSGPQQVGINQPSNVVSNPQQQVVNPPTTVVSNPPINVVSNPQQQTTYNPPRGVVSNSQQQVVNPPTTVVVNPPTVVANTQQPSVIDYAGSFAVATGNNKFNPSTLLAQQVQLATLNAITDNSFFDVNNKSSIFSMDKTSFGSKTPILTNVPAAASQTRDYSSTFLKNDTDIQKILYSSLRRDQNQTFSAIAVTAADKLIEEMNKDSNAGWHTIGEPMIDAVNAVRYTIMKSADGDNTCRNILSHFTAEVQPGHYYNITSSKSGSVFAQSAREDINEWFKGAVKIPVIIMLGGGSHGSKDSNDYRNQATPADMLSLMEPLRPNKSLFAWTQYRTNQIEFLGAWDAHDWKNSNSKIASSSATDPISLTPQLTKPVVWAPTPEIYGSESYVNDVSASQSSVSNAQASEVGNINFYTALSSAVDTLYDDTDGDYTTGHRQGFYAPQWDSVGYSLSTSLAFGTMGNKNLYFGPNAASDPTVDTLGALQTMLFLHTQNQYNWDENPAFKEVHAGLPETEVKPYNVLNNGTILGSVIGYEPEANLDKLINIK